MAEIIPFRGIRYADGFAGDCSRLVAPPYDVISPELQEELYRKHDRNIVRIDFGKAEASDTPGSDRYARSARYLREWLGEGTLRREDAPAFYYYEVDYTTPAGDKKTMTGFISLLKLEDWDNGVVLPHEGTLKGPKADRFELMKATGASTSQIFSLYSDPEMVATKAMHGAVAGKSPDEDAVDGDGARHRLWAVGDPAAIKAVCDSLKDKKIFIADGHHRYETALAFRNHCRANGSTGRGYEYAPMFLANMDEDGLTVLPTHRLMADSAGLGIGDILERAGRYFDVETFPFGDDEAAARKKFLDSLVKKGETAHTFGLYFGGEKAFCLLTLKELDPLADTIRCSHSEAYCKLDVSILHGLIIERVLGIDTNAIAEQQPVKFEKDADRAIERVKSGEFAMCFLLNATKVQQVKDIALAREIMPQKSTYFYPKLLTGLVIAELVPVEK